MAWTPSYFAIGNLLWGRVERARADRRRALIACGAALSGAGIALAISVWSQRSSHIPGESFSWVRSYDWFGSLVFYSLRLAIWGPVAAAIGVSVSLWLAFGLAVVVTVTLISVPAIRHLPAAPPPATAAMGTPDDLRVPQGRSDHEPGVSRRLRGRRLCDRPSRCLRDSSGSWVRLPA
jgi:hypothetical protein